MQYRGQEPFLDQERLPTFLCAPATRSSAALAAGVESLRLGGVGGEDRPGCTHLAKRPVIDRRIGDVQVRGLNDLRPGETRVHGGLEDACREQGPFDGIGGAAVAEVDLDRVRERL